MNIDYREVANLTEQALNSGEYEAADRFLNQMLYETAPEIAKPLLNEHNMVLKILTETLLCERKRGTGDSWGRFHRSYAEFFTAYQALKRAVRRIWFGLCAADQAKINEVISEYPVSADLLAVVAKYSVPPELWGDLYDRLIERLDEHSGQLGYELRQYQRWLYDNGLQGSGSCRTPGERKGELPYRKLNFRAGAIDKGASDAGKPDPNMLAIIFCSNDESYAAECRTYLDYLALPKGMMGEIIEINGAPGMAAGYSFAMRSTAAKYKLYIHHDTMLLDPELLKKTIRIFKEEENCGMLGVFGTTRLPESGRWAQSSYEDSVLTLYQDAILNILPPKDAELLRVRPAEAIDGAFLATSTDVPWRMDLFDGWHFYDISQCFEIKKAGYGLRLVEDSTPWILHESTLRTDPRDLYSHYCEIFRENYS